MRFGKGAPFPWQRGRQINDVGESIGRYVGSQRDIKTAAGVSDQDVSWL